MKRYASVVILLLILLTIKINAQVKTKPIDLKNPTCDECYCIPHSYPQQICFENPNVNFDQTCVVIPLNEEFRNKNKKFLKYNNPICYKYNDSEFPLTIAKRLFKGYSDTEPLDSWIATKDTILGATPEMSFYPIFSLNSIYDENNSNSLIDRVFREWKKNCPTSLSDTSVRDSGKECCVSIYWSTEAEDFVDELNPIQDVQYNLAKTFGIKEGRECDSVKFDCNFQIIINASRELFSPESYSGYEFKLPTKYFFTDSIPIGIDPITNLDYSNDIKFFSLEDVLLHELGHVLGFEHTIDSCPGTESETIMAPTQSSHTKYGLSWRDRCAYKRANCCPIPPSTPMIRNGSACDLASTVEQIKKLQALSYPNPADQWVFVPTTAEGNYSVEIYDYVGRQYFNGSLESFDSKIGIPVGHLANGNYVIRVTMSKNIQDFSIVISR